MKNIIQIAGIVDDEDAQILAGNGVDYIGVPLCMNCHEDEIAHDNACQALQKLPHSSMGVLITYLNDADQIAELCNKLGTVIVQLHGDIEKDELKKLSSLVPNVGIMKSLIVKGDDVWELGDIIDDFSAYVDAFITDTYDHDTQASGATGKTHDWEVSKKLVEISSKPIFLAGGLTPENVADAIRMVKPAGVNCHTGVEDEKGKKDPSKVSAFIQQARAAFAEIS
ncbi:MAG: phosphoribosylanthranilate isomerase [Deltaproteobacteria bacterium]|nr:phosphoribosylanthranilate isomerase [Deltaproteobacteria bacterium]